MILTKKSFIKYGKYKNWPMKNFFVFIATHSSDEDIAQLK